MPASITFAGYTFDTAGTPRWTMANTYEGDGGVAKTVRTRVSVVQTFQEKGYASNMARWAALMAALQAGEGMLRITDENGGEVFAQVVRVVSDDLPDEWRQYVASVTVTFEGRKQLSNSASAAASFTPFGGSPILLPNIRNLKEGIRITRHSPERSSRRESIVTIAADGIVMADKSLDPSARLAALRVIAETFRGVDSKEGTLTIGGLSQTVRVESLDSDMGDGSESLEWSMTATWKRFPDGDYAEAEYEATTRDDVANGETVTNVQGTIRAKDKASAAAKQAALKAMYASSGTLSNEQSTDAEVDGEDGASVWISRKFSFEFKKAIPDITSYDLKVSTRADVKSADTVISYEGRVVGSGIAAALAVAREVGLGKHPMMQQSSETVSTRKSGTDDETFVEVAFSYSYITKGEWKYAEVTYARVRDPFGDHKETVSGMAVAATLADAQELGRSFKLSARLPREVQETEGKRHAVNATNATQPEQFIRFDFVYGYYLTPTAVSCGYSKEDSTDYSSAERTITFNGTVRGPTEAACNAYIDLILGAEAHGKLVQKVRTAVLERQDLEQPGNSGPGEQLMSVNFTQRYTSPVESNDDVDILQAEYSLAIVYSINKAVLTPIPYGTPHVQTGCGVTIGTKTVTGSVKSISAVGGKTWGRARRTLATSGGYEEPQQERTAYEYQAQHSDTAKSHRFEFTYAAKFPTLYFS